MAICKYCNRPDLHWFNIQGRWRLYEDEGRAHVHTCQRWHVASDFAWNNPENPPPIPTYVSNSYATIAKQDAIVAKREEENRQALLESSYNAFVNVLNAHFDDKRNGTLDIKAPTPELPPNFEHFSKNKQKRIMKILSEEQIALEAEYHVAVGKRRLKL